MSHTSPSRVTPIDRCADFAAVMGDASAMDTEVRSPDLEGQNREQGESQHQEKRSGEIPMRGRLFWRLGRVHSCSAAVE